MQKLSLSPQPNRHLSNISTLHSSGFSAQPTLQTFQGTITFANGNNIILDFGNRQISLQKHDNIITSTVICPKRKWIISGQLASPGNKNYESPVMIWSIQNQKLVQALSGLRDGVKKVIVSDNQNFLAGSSLKNQLVIWDLKNYQQIWVKQFENSLTLIKMREDCIIYTHAKILQQANLVPLIQANKSPQINNYTLPSTGLPRLYLSLCEVGADKYLLGTQGGQVCFFDKGIFKWMENIGKGRVTSMHLCDNGGSLLAVVQNQIVKYGIKQSSLSQIQRAMITGSQKLVPYKGPMFLLQSKRAIYQFDSSAFKYSMIKFSHSSRVSAIDARAGLIASIQKTGQTLIRKWNNQSKTPQMIGLFAPKNQTQGICVHIRQDASILNGYLDGYIRCITPKGELQWQFSAHKNGVTSIFTSNLYTLSGGNDSVVRIWGAQNNKLINQISVHQKAVSRVLGDQNQLSLIHSCSVDKSLHTYDMKSDKKVNFRTLPNGSFSDMNQLSNGQLMTVGFGMPVCLWDLKSVNPSQSMESQGDRIISLGTCGTLAALGSDQGKIFIADLTKKSYIGWWQAHSRQVTSLKWIDNKTLVSGSDDNSVTIWQV